MMKIEDATPDQLRQQSRRITDAALQAISGPHFDTREKLIRCIQAYQVKCMMELQRQIMTGRDLTEKERSNLIIQSSICNVYVIALMEIAGEGSTQWDDDFLFCEQFRARVVALFGAAKLMDPDSGEVHNQDGTKL